MDVMRRRDRVSGVIADSGGKRHALPATFTVGADGRNSVLARRLQLFAWHPAHRRVALLQRFQADHDRGDLGEVYLGKAGYCIVNPQGAGIANVVVVVDQRDLPLHRPWDGVFRTLLAPYPAVVAMLEGARALNSLRVLGPLACHAKRVVGDGFLLVGDAAGYYEPMTGEGVYQALRGAELAARVVAEALSNGGPTAEALERYADLHRREFVPKNRVCRLLQSIVRRPGLCEILVRRLSVRPAQGQDLMGVVGDLSSPRSLFRPCFWLRLLLGGSLDSAVRGA
jgi:flavin-dependent dehydrogenase